MNTLNWSDPSSKTKERCSDCPHDECQCNKWLVNIEDKTEHDQFVEQVVINIQTK